MISKKYTLLTAIILVVLVGALSFRLRWVALRGLDTDNDESVYTAWMGAYYAHCIETGDFRSIVSYRGNYEHPPLLKLINGAAIYISGVKDNAEGIVFVCRLVSAALSVIHALLLSFISPLAALFFAVDSWQIFYSAKAWLDSGTTLFVSIAICSLLLVRPVPAGKERGWSKYLAVSAAALGLSFASKYITFFAGFVVLYYLLAQYRAGWKYLLFYAGAVLAAFFIFDPNLWVNPVGNLWKSLTFHQFYSGSSALMERYLQRFGHKPVLWQQLIFLLNPDAPWGSRLIIFRWDRVIFALGFLGVYNLYRRNRLLFAWFAVSLLFIIFYPIKWPHYSMVFIPALCVSAGFFARQACLRLFCFIGGLAAKRVFDEKAVEEKIKHYEKPAVSVLVLILLLAAGPAARGLKIEPNYAKAHNALGAVLAAQKKYAQAQEEFSRAMNQGPELDAYAHLNIAQIYISQDNLDAAEKELLLAINISPGFSEAHRLLGDIRVKRGDSGSAMEEYSRMADKSVKKPDVAVKYVNEGMIYYKQHKYGDAERAYGRAIEADPGNADARNNIAVIYIEQNRLKEAEDALKKAVALNPDYGNAYRNLGVVYAKQNRLSEAVSQWEKSLKINPNDAAVREYIERARKMQGK
jgi:tetratricopeptide (TPR) repeat protein